MNQNITIEIIQTGSLECNTIFLYNKYTKKGIIIDPGEDLDIILKKINEDNIDYKILLHTHAHLDHIGISSNLKKTLNIPIYLHIDDKELYKNLPLQALMMGRNISPPSEADYYFNDKDKIEIDGISLDIIHTPGHSQGSSCFMLKQENQEDILFSGDTLFNGSIGRTDLPGGDGKQIINSIKMKLFTLDNNTKVIPGHGNTTSIQKEKESNPFFTSEQYI